jgi:hypothetical protein
MKSHFFQMLFSGAVLLIGLSSVEVRAQAKTAVVMGQVVDRAESVPIPQAHVWIHGQGGGFYQQVDVEKDGKFSVVVPEGYYYVLIGSSGFAPVTKSLWLRVGSSTVLKVRLLPDSGNLQDN